MPLQLPPGNCPRTPSRTVLTAGTVLWRVHSRTFAAEAFNPVPADRKKYGGGRFDCTSARVFPYLYAAPDESTALAETLLRDLRFDDKGRRTVPRAKIRGLRLSAVEPATDLTLLSLVDSVDLAGICTDEWLVHAGPLDYDLTRRWARWLHERQPWAQGLAWQSRRDQTHLSVMIFGDRCPPLTTSGAGYDLDDPGHLATLNARLAPYGAYVHPGRR